MHSYVLSIVRYPNDSKQIDRSPAENLLFVYNLLDLCHVVVSYFYYCPWTCPKHFPDPSSSTILFFFPLPFNDLIIIVSSCNISTILPGCNAQETQFETNLIKEDQDINIYIYMYILPGCSYTHHADMGCINNSNAPGGLPRFTSTDEFFDFWRGLG